MLIQQGDVLFMSITDLPANCKSRNNPILVKGETTGHHHAIATDTLLESLEDILYEDKHGDLYIKNEKPITITHQEHRAIDVPPGIWKVERVKEYDHFLEESRFVHD